MTFKQDELSVKISSLAAEARIIRQKELRITRQLAQDKFNILGRHKGYKRGDEPPEGLEDQLRRRIEPCIRPDTLHNVVRKVDRVAHKAVRKFLRSGLTKEQILELPGMSDVLGQYRRQETLVWHRRVPVRHEARHSQLAMAFLCGRDYAKTENGAKSYPSWDKVYEIAARFSREDRRIVAQRFEQWCQEGKQFIRGREICTKSKYPRTPFKVLP